MKNHAGCERGYFRTKDNKFIALPKKDENGENLLLPDVVLKDDSIKEIYDVEGKLLSTLDDGLREVETYDSIENEYIKPNYPDYSIKRWVTIFGGNNKEIPHNKVIIYVNLLGEVYVNKNAPNNIKNAFRCIGINC